MPIDSKHPDYKEHISEWTKCSDFNDGAKAVKAKKKIYLPKPDGMTNSEYNAYVHRASFFNGMGRTVTGLVGSMTRVDTEVTLPPLIESLKQDATGSGKTLQELIKQVLGRVMISGRVGVLTDRGTGLNEPVKFVVYNERSIINWRVEKDRLVMLVLEEHVEEINEEDPYESEIVPQYRELILDAEGVYRARIWKRVKQGKNAVGQMKFTPGAWMTPESSTGPLTEIPFVFFSPVGTEASVVKAPLGDLCEVNMSHYMVSADLEHGRHLVSLPTPWVTGVSKDDHKDGLKAGGGTAWLIDDPQADVGMLEFTGKGLGHLAEAITEKQHQMAILGAKLLQPQRKQVESAELARMANAGDESILVGISKSVGLGMEMALKFAAIWQGANENNVSVSMNTDFIDTKLASDELMALNELYLSDVITLDEFLEQLKVGERLQGDPQEIAAKAVAQAKERQQKALTLEQSKRSDGGSQNVRGDRTTVAAE